MTTETLEQNAIVKIVETSGLEKTTAANLINSFEPLYLQMLEWKDKAYSIVVTDATQLTEMSKAREMRLALMKIRTDSDKVREAQKADALRYGNTVQAIYNFIKDGVTPLEKHLKDQEDFAKVQEQKRKDLLAQTRLVELQQYDFVYNTGFDLGNMDEQMYHSLLAGLKKTKEDKILAEKIAENERIKKEEIVKLHNERKESILPLWNYTSPFEKTLNFGEQSETDFNNLIERLNKAKSDDDAKQLQIKTENERLKKEAEDKAKEFAAEKSKADEEKRIADAEIKKAQEEKTKLEAQLKAKADKEASELKTKLEAEKKAAKQPDKIKLTAWVRELSFSDIELKSEESKLIAKDIKQKFIAFKLWCETQISTL